MFGIDQDGVQEMFNALRDSSGMDAFAPLKDKHFGGIDPSEDTMAEVESLIYSVCSSGDRYCMVSLGAAPGEWAVRAERAYFKKNPGGNFISYCFEADIEHVKMIKEFMERNSAILANHTITYAAAAGVDGFAYFPIINPETDWGAGVAAISDRQDDLAEKITITESAKNDRIAANGGKPLEFQTVKALALATIINEAHCPIDYIHSDIQGAEIDVFPPALEILTSSARVCCIATHASDIEQALVAAFEQHGWTLECGYAGRAGRDGTFVWSNPRFMS